LFNPTAANLAVATLPHFSFAREVGIAPNTYEGKLPTMTLLPEPPLPPLGACSCSHPPGRVLHTKHPET